MRPKHSTSTKIISEIMDDLSSKTILETKKRLRNNYKHLKYLWKWHAKEEGEFFKLRQIQDASDDEMYYISDHWKCSYRIQSIMAWAGIWKWMSIR